MKLGHVLLAAAVLAVLGASAYLGLVLRDRGDTGSALTWEQLANATYPSELVRSKQVTLHGGAHEEQAAPGSASKLQVRLADTAGFGKIAGSSRIDAAVVLVSSGGGSGTFIELVAVLNRGGSPQPAAASLLGDRVAVRGIEVKDRDIVVRMRVRGAAEPLTSLTHEVTRTYALLGNQLVMKDETAADIPSTPPSQFTYKTETVTLAPGGDAFTNSDVLAPGQSVNFIVHAEAGQRLKAIATSEFNSAILSIQGLGDLTQLVSRADFAPASDLLIPSTQDYSVRVISLAGADLRFSLSMTLSRASTPTAIPRTPTPAATVKVTVSVPTPTRGAGSARPSIPPNIVLKGPFAPTARPIAALAPDAVQFAQTRSQTWGAAVGQPAGNVLYSLNGDAQLELASVVKVLIMAAVLGEADGERRYVDNAELSLLWPMITESDNDAATALWTQIGGGRGLASYLKSSGFTGVTPYDGDFWGTSTASANALVAVLSRMIFGDLLTEEHRKLALTLMESVTPQQRWGVSAGADPANGDVIALKDGWYQADEGWRVNSIGVILPRNESVQPYAVAVLSNLQPTFSYGIQTIEGIAQRASAGINGAPASGSGR